MADDEQGKPEEGGQAPSAPSALTPEESALLRTFRAARLGREHWLAWARDLWRNLGLTLGRQLAFVLRDDHIYLILMATVVGIASGAAAGLLLWWIDYAIASFPHPSEDRAALRWVMLLSIPTLGGLLAGLLRVLAWRYLHGQPVTGVPGVTMAIAKRGGSLRGRSAAIAGLGTGLTIGSGGSCGHEGPSVAIGAAVGSVLARFFGLQLRRHLAMVGAGCAGGLAAAFNAPLGGVVFTVELVFGGAIGGNVGTMSVFVPLIVAAVAGTFTSHFIRGDVSTFHLLQHEAPTVEELGFYVVLALLAGLLGSGMSRALLETRRGFDRLRAPLWLKPAIGGLGVGLLAAIFSNEILGTGHDLVDEAVHGNLVWQSALLLLWLKLLATAITLGSGGFGGAFMPSLYVGACLGTVVGTVAAAVLGSAAQDTGAYALIGMGAIFAAMMHAPLTPIVMLFELTRDYGIILPLMLGCILAVAVARRVNGLSYYRMVLQQQGFVLAQEAEREVMYRGTVRQLMVDPHAVLSRDASLDAIRSVTLEATHGATFVLDDEGVVVGFINGDRLSRALLRGAVRTDSTAADVMSKTRLTLLYPTDSLASAVMAFARSEQEVLPVVDGESRLLGVLRLGDVLTLYSEKVLGEREELLQIHAEDGGPAEELGLGRGLVIDRVVVGRAWAGRTLAELALRTRTGASVLEWSRNDHILPVDPRRPLLQGDVLALCGTREQLMRARHAG